MSGNDVSAESAVRRHRTLQIDAGFRLEGAQIGAAHGLRHDVAFKSVSGEANHGQTNAVDGDGITELRAAENRAGANAENRTGC